METPEQNTPPTEDHAVPSPTQDEARARNRTERQRRKALGKKRLDALVASERLNEEDFAIRINARG